MKGNADNFLNLAVLELIILAKYKRSNVYTMNVQVAAIRKNYWASLKNRNRWGSYTVLTIWLAVFTIWPTFACYFLQND